MIRMMLLRTLPGTLGCSLLLTSPSLANPPPSDGPPDFPSREAWSWLVSPIGMGGRSEGDSGILCARRYDGMSQWITLARSAEGVPDPAPRLDLILFDADGNRLENVSGGVPAQGGGVLVWEYVYDKSDLDVAYVGIEEASLEALRTLSVEAREAARKEGVATLPFPELGSPFSIDLDMGPGGTVRAADYRGKVVLVECWASWCVPCMAQMPKLRAIYEKYHDRGFDIVGVNFDRTREKAEAAIAKEGLPWPQVLMEPKSFRVWELWGDASRFGGIPRLFLVDPEGVLRWDSWAPGATIDELDDQIVSLLGG